jgi:hypothetical protein
MQGMSQGQHGTASAPLSREQVLDELEFLATIEHALVVEYLSVCCALGHDLEAAEGGATTKPGRTAAGAASVLAQGEMFHLKAVNRALIAAGRSPQLGRATSISSDAVAETALGPPSRAQLERLLAREEAITSAVDQRYWRLRPAVTSHPVFDGDLLDEMKAVIDDGATHVGGFAGLRDSLGDLAPTDFLRVTRREATDAFEQRLLDVCDRTYGLILAALHEWFAQEDVFIAGTFRGFAVSAMENLDGITRVLVQRGLLPPFTLA